MEKTNGDVGTLTEKDIKTNKLGLLFAFLLACVVTAAVVYAFIMGHNILAGSLSVSFIALCFVFWHNVHSM